MQPVLDIQDLRIGHKGVLLQNINCSAGTGELIILTGINGSGKSTLLKTIAGILKPLGGSIRISGTDTSHAGQHTLAGLLAFCGTGRISESYISIRDLVSFGLYPYAEHRLSIEQQDFIDSCMKTMDVYKIRDKYLNQVSDGEWQKANIARVLAQKTPLIIMDEPTVFLDYPSRGRLFSDLKQICATESKTILLSTHDVDTAAAYGNAFWHIENGHLHCSDKAPVWSL